MTKSRSLASAVRNVHIERKIEELGYTLPAVAEPKGNYRTCVRSGNTIYLAGHLPQPAGGDLILGKVGKDLSPEEGYDAAHACALSIMATLKQEVGDLDKIKRVVKLVGFVNCVDGFTQQPAVINGASDTIGKVFGDKGIHARSAVGTNALPLNVAVEVEAVVEIEE
ncbi:Endoribonuclease L-PSP [Phytophthora megakarya]|uniref:Endoribonuclease L-PSP n=1 Tax=Phytophthora megakarya TaxID=4795 RepID=A0A225UTV4_9STRA|nr:Endoribonuclease L-PSP [Phytophthora megakarya]